MTATAHVGHAESDIAYHAEWEFRREAMIWVGDRAMGPNLYPAATRLRAWMLRQGHLELFNRAEADLPGGISNPYTYDATTLAILATGAINDNHAFATAEDDALDPIDAEIRRVRLYSELTLTRVRFCEASIKQLLYCTAMPAREYQHAALGGLLSLNCRGCRNSAKPHRWSLLGSLAHRYGLCLRIDGCLIEHLKVVNRQRNVEVAHSSVLSLNVRDAAASRAQALTDMNASGEEFLHLLEHLAELEEHMLGELNGRPVGFVRGRS